MSARLESNSNDYDSNEISRASSGVGFVGGDSGSKSTNHDDLPTAMDAEVYVDGKLEFKSKKKSKKEKDSLADKKRKEMKQKRDFAEICSVFRLFWATRQTEDIDKEKEADRYTKITLRELAIYVVFVIILCVIAFGMISGLTYTFTNVLTDAFISSPTSDTPPLTFANINQMADIWKILLGPFLDNLYSDWYDTNENNTQDLSKYVANENRVLGLARMRQVRVKSNSCVVPSDFSVEIKYCYSDWAASVEDQSPYGLYVSQNITNVTAWYYQSQSQLDGSSYQGLMNNYGGGGFILDLSQDKATSRALIQYLFDNLWIDRGTRAVFVDFTVYNANINLFGQIKLAFELPATGGVTPSFIVRAVKLIRYVSIFDYVILACEILFCAFIVYYLIEEAIEIKKHKLSYFKSVWNVLDVFILVLAIICVAFNVYRQIKVNQLLEGLLANDEQYFDFDFLCYWQSVFNGTLAFMVFLAWIKIFKYVSFNKTMTQLSMTLSRCAKDVIGFAIMFFIVFLAYAQLGFLIFGTQIYEYSTFSETIFSLFRLVLGDFDFGAMEQANRVLGPIFFLTYVFFVFFVLLNMFIAIINDTYGEIKMEISSQKSDIELASFFKRRYDKLMDKLNLKRTHIVDIHQAVKSSDINSDKKIDFIEWRNNLRNKGYGDVEIETLFARYDLDGDRCLNETEQMAMLKDLAEQNAEIKEAYKVINHSKEENKENEEFKKRKRCEGVTFEDYHLLSQRIDKMESSIGSITNKIDSVLNKLDNTKSERIHSGRKSNDSKWETDSRGSRAQLRNSNSAGTSHDKNKQEQSNIGRQKETSSFSLLADRSINPMHGTQSDC